MKQILKKMSIILLPLVLVFCNKKEKPCTYKEYEGEAMIISIDIAPSDEYNCPTDPKKVMFAFVPNDSSVRDNYLFPYWSDTASLTIYAGMNPSQQLLDSLGIIMGSTFKCKRQEITQGTCTPVCFVFPELNLNSENACR